MAFNALSDSSKRFVGALGKEFRDRFQQPATPSTVAPGSPGPAPDTPGGQAVMLDIPADLQRYYEEQVAKGMPEERARRNVQEVLEDRMSYQHGSMGASWQQGHHPRNGAHNYFWGAHKKNEGTRNIAEDFWRYHGMPEPVQGEHAIELNKQLINLGLGKDHRCNGLR